MSFLLTLLLFIMFFYLLNRVNDLEKKVSGFPTEKQFKPSETDHYQQTRDEVFKKNESVEAVIRPEEQSKKQGETNTEFALGSKVMTGIGVLALLLGVGFFLRYAFENNIISESGRVLL